MTAVVMLDLSSTAPELIVAQGLMTLALVAGLGLMGLWALMRFFYRMGRFHYEFRHELRRVRAIRLIRAARLAVSVAFVALCVCSLLAPVTYAQVSSNVCDIWPYFLECWWD